EDVVRRLRRQLPRLRGKLPLLARALAPCRNNVAEVVEEKDQPEADQAQDPPVGNLECRGLGWLCRARKRQLQAGLDDHGGPRLLNRRRRLPKDIPRPQESRQNGGGARLAHDQPMKEFNNYALSLPPFLNPAGNYASSAHVPRSSASRRRRTTRRARE